MRITVRSGFRGTEALGLRGCRGAGPAEWLGGPACGVIGAHALRITVRSGFRGTETPNLRITEALVRSPGTWPPDHRGARPVSRYPTSGSPRRSSGLPVPGLRITEALVRSPGTWPPDHRGARPVSRYLASGSPRRSSGLPVPGLRITEALVRSPGTWPPDHRGARPVSRYLASGSLRRLPALSGTWGLGISEAPLRSPRHLAPGSPRRLPALPGTRHSAPGTRTTETAAGVGCARAAQPRAGATPTPITSRA
ncbi:hypothetical protein RKD20_003290 [Streptomyces sp. SLBN-8D4]